MGERAELTSPLRQQPGQISQHHDLLMSSRDTAASSRLPRWLWELLRVGLTAVGFLGVFLGPALFGALPSMVMGDETRQSALIMPFAFLGLGVLCLVLARWLRPPLARAPRAVFGALVGWLAFCVGALVFGAGGGWLGVPLLVVGALLVTRAQRAESRLLLDEGPEGCPWLVPALHRLAQRPLPLDELVAQMAERFDLDEREQGQALSDLQQIVDGLLMLAPRVQAGLSARSRAIKLARRRYPFLDHDTAAAMIDRASKARER
jgi:hypothetical protein